MMSRQKPKSRSHPRPKQGSVNAEKESLWVRFARRVLRWPRVVRVIIALLFSLAVTLLISLVVFYESLFYSRESSMILMIIAMGVGVAMYVAGWQLIVGTVGEKLPVRLAVLWYFGIGALSVFLIVLWLIQSASMSTEAI